MNHFGQKFRRLRLSITNGKIADVLVNTSLFFIFVAGITFLALPESILGIPKNDFSGGLRLWASSLKLFAIPLCLLIMSFTKHVLIQVGIVFWAFWLLMVSLFFLMNTKEQAPNLTLYGRGFIAIVIVFSLCQLIFSSIRFLPKDLKLPKTDDPPVNPS